MADPTPGAPKPKKAPAYELVVNESGVMRRVPVAAPTGPAGAGAGPARPAIASAAVRASVAGPPPPPPPPPTLRVLPPEEEEDEIVFNEEGTMLTGEARRAYLARQAAAPAEPVEEELVFGEEGEVLTGEARAAALSTEPVRARPLPAFATTKVQKPKVKKLRLPKKARNFLAADPLDKMRLFFKFRSKFPESFTYTAEGNLEIKENKYEIPASVIPLRAFSELRPEEREEIETKQKEDQAGVETAYVAKMKELREANAAYAENPADPALSLRVVQLNEELRGLSVQRNRALYPERWIHLLENPAIRDLRFDQPHEERKFGYDGYMLKRSSMAIQDANGHYRAHGEAAAGGQAGGGTTVLFISSPEDPTTGLFHPATELEFVYNETKYASPYQAYETERFKELEEDYKVKQLLGTRSARTIQQLVKEETRQPQNAQKLWEDILEALYSQHKDRAEKLKATGSARFHMMDKQIGTPLYSNALATVRTKLKEKDTEAPSGGEVVKQSVITKDEQEKAKVGAIINNFRRG